MTIAMLLLAIDLNSLILFLLIGTVAGWLAGTLMKGGGFGLIGNLVVGVIGAFLGGMLLNWMGIAWGGLLGSLATALIGAIVLLLIVRVLKRA